MSIIQNNSPLLFDGSGRLLVALTGAGSGGTSSVDGDAFTANVSAGTPMMAEDPTSGQLRIAQMSPGTRQLLVAANVTVTPVTSNAASAAAQTTVGTTAAQMLAGNAGRKRLALQNQGTTVIKIVLGAGTPTQSVYHFSLPAAGSTNDGSSPIYLDTMWTGAVQAISSAAGGLLQVTELT